MSQSRDLNIKRDFFAAFFRNVKESLFFRKFTYRIDKNHHANGIKVNKTTFFVVMNICARTQNIHFAK